MLIVPFPWKPSKGILITELAGFGYGIVSIPWFSPIELKLVESSTETPEVTSGPNPPRDQLPLFSTTLIG